MASFLRSSLQVLGIPKDLVEFERNTNSLDDLMVMARGNFNNMARFLHPDRNPHPGASELYMQLSDAFDDIKDPDGLALAIERLVGENEKRTNRHRINDAEVRAREQKSLQAVLRLLENVGQFNILGIAGPTSFLLQFGASRTILDVDSKDEATLFMTSQDLEVLPEQTDKAEFAEGHWKEMYLADEVELWLSHIPKNPAQVRVVGFVPPEAQHYSTEDAVQVIPQQRAELGEGVTELRMTPVWTEPSEAWFLPFLKPKPKKHSEVVVRDRRGLLAIIGSIQAQAFFYEKQ